MPAVERKDLTVRAVIDLCACQDPATVTTAEIAERMNLTQGALFRHFPNKDAIWESVADWVSAQLMRRLDAVSQDSAGPLDALERMFMGHVEFIARHPGVPRLMFGQLQHIRQTPARRTIDAMLAAYRARLTAILAAADARDELVPGLDRDAAAVAFIGAIQGLVMQSMIAGNVARLTELAPSVFALYRRGIIASGASG
jgi:AcrR family transcriptional regulator